MTLSPHEDCKGEERWVVCRCAQSRPASSTQHDQNRRRVRGRVHLPFEGHTAHQAVRQVTVGKRGQNRVVVAQSEVWEKLALTANCF